LAGRVLSSGPTTRPGLPRQARRPGHLIAFAAKQVDGAQKCLPIAFAPPGRIVWERVMRETEQAARPIRHLRSTARSRRAASPPRPKPHQAPRRRDQPLISDQNVALIGWSDDYHQNSQLDRARQLWPMSSQLQDDCRYGSFCCQTL
jgi:hypothetical protein